MAQNKKVVLVYADWIDKFEALDDDEAGRLIKHFFRYINDQNPEFPDKLTKISFLDIQNTLKRDFVKWEERAERSRLNGNKGGRPPKQINLEEPEETQQVISKPKKPDSVKVKDTVTVSDKDTVKEKVNNYKEEVKKNSATPTNSIEKFKLIAKESFEENNCEFGNSFKSIWLKLIQTKKWRKKEQSAINLCLKKVMKYEEDFAIVLAENALAGEYQGITFSDTDNHYQKYLRQKNGTATQSTDSKTQSRHDMVGLARKVLSAD